MGISFRHRGSFKRTESFLKKVKRTRFEEKLKPYGDKGVEALAAATPVDSGLTSDSWSYEILADRGGITINWYNSNVNQGFNIALGIQYGHGHRGGGWIEGIDYINPALRPVFDEIAEAIWTEILSW